LTPSGSASLIILVITVFGRFKSSSLSAIIMMDTKTNTLQHNFQPINAYNTIELSRPSRPLSTLHESHQPYQLTNAEIHADQLLNLVREIGAVFCTVHRVHSLNIHKLHIVCKIVFIHYRFELHVCFVESFPGSATSVDLPQSILLMDCNNLVTNRLLGTY
jgi:hypothetical protein